MYQVFNIKRKILIKYILNVVRNRLNAGSIKSELSLMTYIFVLKFHGLLFKVNFVKKN